MWDVIEERTEKYDPGNAYSINYMWGTTGIGVNVGKVQERLGEDAPIEQLGSVFDPENMEKLEDCGVHLLDAPTEMIPAALNYIGEDPDSHDPDVIAKAKAGAGRPPLCPEVPLVGIHQRAGQWRHLRGGRLVRRHAAGARPRGRGRQRRRDRRIRIPKEGALMWFDQMAIPVDAPTRGAHASSSTSSWRQNMAKASNYVYYANGNEASKEFLIEDVIGDPAIYPDEATLENLYTTRPTRRACSGS
jgi:putrescine transport system substrate-binding protein